MKFAYLVMTSGVNRPPHRASDGRLQILHLDLENRSLMRLRVPRIRGVRVGATASRNFSDLPVQHEIADHARGTFLLRS
jgi:hypothetical protein